MADDSDAHAGLSPPYRSGREPSGPACDGPRCAELVADERRGCMVGRLWLRVRYAETDRMGIVYNGHYLTWFEVGRTELMRCAGFPYRSVEERGINLPLVEASLRLRAPVCYDDVIAIETWISRVRSRAIVFSYCVYHEEQPVAEGSTTHACVAAQDNRTVAMPAWLAERVATLLEIAS
jgi:acyl-CoA thioester hydrolase